MQARVRSGSAPTQSGSGGHCAFTYYYTIVMAECRLSDSEVYLKD